MPLGADSLTCSRDSFASFGPISPLAARSWPFVLLSAGAAVLCTRALAGKRFTLAFVSAAATVACMAFGWAAAQYPAIIVPDVTIDASKAPRAVLLAMAWTVAVGSIVLVPSLVLLFRLFKTKRAE